MLVTVVWYQNVDRCFGFNVAYSIHNVYVGILSFCWFLIANEASCLSCNWVTFDFDWYDTVMSRRNLKCWFDNSYCCLLCAVLGVCEKSAILLYLASLLLAPSIWYWEFLLSMPKIISVSGNLSQMMKLWINLNSAIWGGVLSFLMLSMVIHLLYLTMVVFGWIGV